MKKQPLTREERRLRRAEWARRAMVVLWALMLALVMMFWR